MWLGGRALPVLPKAMVRAPAPWGGGWREKQNLESKFNGCARK
jgi:hypothetical protein